MKHLLALSLLSASAMGFSPISSSEPSTGPGPDAVQLPAASSGANATIVIKTEPLQNHTTYFEINGQRGATIEGNQVYTALIAPGPILITVPGGKAESKAEFNAEADKEYVFEVALLPIPVYFGLGLIGELVRLAAHEPVIAYSIALKETKSILAAPPQPR